eukprot:tig00000670_g3025.t1
MGISGISFCELVFALQRDFPSAITSCQAELRQYIADIKHLVDKFSQTLGQKHALSAACAIHLGRLYNYFELDNCDAAITHYELALELYAEDSRLRAATEPGALGEHAEALGALYRRKADFCDEKRALLWALSFRWERLGPLHETTTETEYRLGVCLHEMGDYERAEAVFKAAFAHEREAGCEGRIAGSCCELPVVPKLNFLASRHVSARRLQRTLEIGQMALPIAERTCAGCFERGDVETVVMGIALACISQGDYSAAVAAAEFTYVCCECGCSTCRKLKERKREREERRRAEEEREQMRQEAERAERAERAARDSADREAARMHVEGSQWAPARKVLDALLKRSPDDFEARLLRIECMAGAGELEAAAQQADKLEHHLIAVETGANAHALRRVQELRRHVAAEQRRREEAKVRAEEAARRRAQEERREREQRQREEQERTEARRRELEEEQRREEERLQEERRQATEAERQREEARRREEAARANEQRRLEEQREARRREQERRLAAGQRRREDPGLQRSQKQEKQHGKGYRPAAAPADAECAICFEPLSAGPPAAALTCRHRFEFHGRCIATWRAEKHAAGCPLCGAPFEFAGPSPPAAATGAAAGAASSSSTPARAERAAGPASPAEGPGPCSGSSASSLPALQLPASPATGTPEGAAAGGPASFSSSSPAPPQAPRRPTRPYKPPGISFA